MFLLGQKVQILVRAPNILEHRPQGWYEALIIRAPVEIAVPEFLGVPSMFFYGVHLIDFPPASAHGLMMYLTPEMDMRPVKPYPPGFLSGWGELERVTGWHRPQPPTLQPTE